MISSREAFWACVVVIVGVAMAFTYTHGRPLYVVREPPAGTRPVWRFWSPAGQCHFYTISERERDKLIEQYADRWIYEGPAFYAWPVPPEPNQ